ncbi:rCG52084 [Rattus norvegicus]|uniref:RCG52084 n=1 Tax=Rattus norvegicus TaxID=10116 RepID=A6K6D8_RAT|nr:rCG52084 [Rattus norvegicus]
MALQTPLSPVTICCSYVLRYHDPGQALLSFKLFVDKVLKTSVV